MRFGVQFVHFDASRSRYAIILRLDPHSISSSSAFAYCHDGYMAKNSKLSCSTYSHTFENKSSLPPNPPAGFAVDDVVLEVDVCAGAEGAALLQPPKSSS